MAKSFCVLGLRAGIGVVVVAGAEKDDPPRFYNRHGRLFTEDRQDDFETNRGVGQEVGGVSGTVRRLFWSASGTRLIAGVCERAIVQSASQNG
jgi:hypothetical protein